MVYAFAQKVTEYQIDESLSKLSFTRVWVELDDAITTITPGSRHEVTCATFPLRITSAIIMIPGHDFLSIVKVGAARFHCCPGKRNKEGDHGMRCSTRFGRGIEWPNLMIEVGGYSEPLSQLRINAEWWLVNSGVLTRMVIIIILGSGNNSPDDALEIEVWARREARLPSSFRLPPMNLNPAGASLTIPYTVLFDNANQSATDTVFSHIQLSAMTTHIFQQS